MKTPEQMAEEYADNSDELRGHLPWKQIKDSFLAGYNAGHAAGFKGAMKMQEAVIEHLEKQMVEEMYVRMEPLLKEEK